MGPEDASTRPSGCSYAPERANTRLGTSTNADSQNIYVIKPGGADGTRRCRRAAQDFELGWQCVRVCMRRRSRHGVTARTVAVVAVGAYRQMSHGFSLCACKSETDHGEGEREREGADESG